MNDDYTAADNEMDRRARMPRWDIALTSCCRLTCNKYRPHNVRSSERVFTITPCSCSWFCGDVTHTVTNDEKSTTCYPCLLGYHRDRRYTSPYLIHDGKTDLCIMPCLCFSCAEMGGHEHYVTPCCVYYPKKTDWTCVICFPWKVKGREVSIPLCCCYKRTSTKTTNHRIEKTSVLGIKIKEDVFEDPVRTQQMR